LVAVAEGDTWTRTRIGAAALPILVIEARRHVAKDVGIAIVVVVILFGLSVGVGFFSLHMTRATVSVGPSKYWDSPSLN
jgi:hypothetical protein